MGRRRGSALLTRSYIRTDHVPASNNTLSLRFRLAALGAVVVLIALVWLYVREFPVLSNTIGVARLALTSVAAAALLCAALLFGLRRRLSPWQAHWPEIVYLVFPLLFFAPLFGSLINRAGGAVGHQSFEFVAETPYLAAGYGILKGEMLKKPTGYLLTVKERGKRYQFKYKTQAYYPITKPGEAVLLPVRKGLLGFRVVTLS